MLRVQVRPSSGGSEQDLIDTAAREDLAKLHRQFRVTEGSRKQYAEHATNALRKQRSMIESLQTENADLRKNLGLASSKQNEVRDKSLVEKFEELLAKQELFKSTIESEEKAITKIDAAIRDGELKMDKQRKDMGGALVTEVQSAVVQKHMRVKENRLDYASVRFNTSLTSNSQLRAMIDHLRKEKAIFENLYRKMQKELVETKKTMGQVVEVSTQAYEARDDAQNKMLALKEKAEKELAQYNVELKELIRVIDHDRRLREFMSCKDKERTEAHEQIEMMKRKKEAEKSGERERTVMSYEQAFEQIKEATGITDIDQLVTKFIEVEDQNFALFNYVNELNGEMELVQEQVQQIQASIEQFKSQGVEMEEKRKEILRDLETELKEVEEDTAASEARYVAATKVLDQLKSGIESVFSKIGCDAVTITDMLGGHAGVTDITVLQYLGIVEQRTNELLQLQAFIQAKESEDPEAMTKFLIGLGAVQTLASTSLVLPSTAEEEVDSEEEADFEGKPMTTEELRIKAMKGLVKREAAKKGAGGVAGTTSQALGGLPVSTATTASSKIRPGGTTDKKKRSVTTQ